MGNQVSLPASVYATKSGNFEVMGRVASPQGYSIAGDRYSVVNATLEPGQSMHMEPGVMMYMSDNVTMSVAFAGWRVFSGEGLSKLRLRNTGNETGYIGLAPNMPFAVVMPLNLSEIPGNSVNLKRGAFMAADETVKVMPKFLPAANLGAMCCGGMPPIIQNVNGSGTAFVNAAGTIIKKDLAAGESLVIDSDSLVGFTDGIGYDIQQVGNFLTCCCGGEGCYNTKLTGPGSIVLQTISYEKLVRLLVTEAGNDGGGGDGGGGGGGAPPASATMER